MATTFNPAAQYSTDKGTRTKLFISKKGEAEGSVLSTEENSDEYEILGLTEWVCYIIGSNLCFRPNKICRI